VDRYFYGDDEIVKMKNCTGACVGCYFEQYDYCPTEVDETEYDCDFVSFVEKGKDTNMKSFIPNDFKCEEDNDEN